MSPLNFKPRNGMDAKKEVAYRHLLYVGLLAIRSLSDSRVSKSLNPISWHKYYLRNRLCGRIADWLHNLALISSLGFDKFDEERFWQDHSLLCSRFPDHNLGRYKEIYEDYLRDETHFF
jgi:hypothetical protein